MTTPSRRRSLFYALATMMIVAWTGSTFAAMPSKRDIDALDANGIILIATVRKDGTQSRPTPVWFTTTDDYTVLIETDPASWKAKRIRRGSPAIIWVPDGPAFIGKAEFTTDRALQDRIIKDYPGRYLGAAMGYNRPSYEKFDKGKSVAIKITIVRDLPDGFPSEPGKPAPGLEAEGRPPAPKSP
jgi:hypothetical protein